MTHTVFFMIKAVLFDMDGVLIDAKDWHYNALNRSLEIFGLNISYDDHIKNFDGKPTNIKLDQLVNENIIPKNLKPYISNLKQYFTHELIMEKCMPNFSHRYLLSKLKNKNMKLALCSNSIKNSISLMIERAKISSFFDLILSNEDVHQPKPHPEIYLKAIKNFQLKPEECLILEDNINGINAAKRSGAHVLEIQSVHDVNFDNVYKTINKINKND